MKSLLLVAVLLCVLVVAQAIRPHARAGMPRGINQPSRARNLMNRQNEVACQQQCGQDNQECVHQCLSPTCFEESMKEGEPTDQMLAFKRCYARERFANRIVRE